MKPPKHIFGEIGGPILNTIIILGTNELPHSLFLAISDGIPFEKFQNGGRNYDETRKPHFSWNLRACFDRLNYALTQNELPHFLVLAIRCGLASENFQNGGLCDIPMIPPKHVLGEICGPILTAPIMIPHQTNYPNLNQLQLVMEFYPQIFKSVAPTMRKPENCVFRKICGPILATLIMLGLKMSYPILFSSQFGMD